MRAAPPTFEDTIALHGKGSAMRKRLLGSGLVAVAATLTASTVTRTVSLTFFILTLLSSNRHLTDAN